MATGEAGQGVNLPDYYLKKGINGKGNEGELRSSTLRFVGGKEIIGNLSWRLNASDTFSKIAAVAAPTIHLTTSSALSQLLYEPLECDVIYSMANNGHSSTKTTIRAYFGLIS
ncbi:hypothetical protein ACTXT7_006400 [Hymenolepis weldensis]